MGNLMHTKNVTDQTFHSEVVTSDKPVLVDFWAESCGPCRMLAPTLEDLADMYADKLIVAKVNVSENPETTAAYGVSSVPFLAVFVEGKPAKTMVGARTKAALLREIADFIQ
jgi:thioredoxin 1